MSARSKIQYMRLIPWTLQSGSEHFLFWRVKEELTGLSLDKDSLMETRVGVTMTIAADEFATAIRQSLKCCKVYSNRHRIHKEKWNNKHFPSFTSCLFI